MMDSKDDFVNGFYNLEGETVKERKKQFFKHLKIRKWFENEEQMDMILNDMQPKNYLESLLYIDTLIYFKRTEKLLEMFKQGNEVFISKIIKQPWFFKEVFKTVTIEELVNEFLPCTSFAVRMKVLKKLSIFLSETQIDHLFDCLEKRYGLYIALNVAHACSSTRLKQILSDNKIILRPSQVKCIINKDLDTFKFYLEYYKTSTGSAYDNKYVAKYVAGKYPEVMLDLKRNGKICISSVGHRISKKIVNLVKDDVMKDLSYYLQFLKHNVVVRKLGNFERIYLDLFPKNEKNIRFWYLSNQLLKYYPRRQRWYLLVKTFSVIFNGDLLENLGLLDEDLVLLCPHRDVVQKWAETMYKKHETDKFLTYFEPSKAITIIKDKINVTSIIYARQSLLELMIKVCQQSDNLTLLEGVLSYFCFRHRNEEFNVRLSFLRNLSYAYRNKMDSFTEKHWQYINEQLELIRLTEKSWCIYTEFSRLIKGYFEFLFRTGKPFINELKLFVEHCISSRNSFLLGSQNHLFEKEFILKIIDLMPTYLNKYNEHQCKMICERLISDMTAFSRANKDYYIDLSHFPFLFDYVKSLLNTALIDLRAEDCSTVETILRYNFTFPEILKIEEKDILEIFLNIAIVRPHVFTNFATEMVTKDVRSTLENKVLQIYFDKVIEKQPVHGIHLWFIRNKPSILLPYIDKVAMGSLQLSCSRYTRYKDISYLKEIKLFSHLGYDITFIDLYKELLGKPNFNNKEHVVKLLSHIDSTENFVTFVEATFLPKKEKLDLNDEQMKKEYTLQCKVAQVLKNVIEPLKMLPVILKFCVGDYLQSSLCSLYSLFYRTPENQLNVYIDVLSKRAVSVKKHAVFLSCEVLNYDFVVQVLTTTKVKNISSQKHLYLAALKYFLKNRTQELFNVVILNMHTIDKNDTETLDSLISSQVPDKYCVIYLEKCWQFFEELRKQEVNVRRYLESILIKTNSELITLFSSEFCKHVITVYFGQRLEIMANVELFTCQVLRYREVEQLENFNFVFEILHKFKNQNNIGYIKDFFRKLYNVAATNLNRNFIKLCNEYWSQLFSPLEMFEEFVLFKFLWLQVESSEPFIENYAKNTVTFIEQIISKYGLLVYTKFVYSFDRAFACWNTVDILLIVDHMLKYKVNPFICLLALHVVNRFSNHSDKGKEIRHHVLTFLKDVNEPIVKMYYNESVR